VQENIDESKKNKLKAELEVLQKKKQLVEDCI
jgi:hypothetical protein